MRVTSELWKTLCEDAANEQDPQRLLELVKQINDLLEEKRMRMRLNGKNVDGTSPNGNGSSG
jgi:hypothetical protein